jgi:hypothetical protein
MKALVVYESMFGNSEQVARAIAEGVGASGEVVLRDAATSTPGEIPEGVELLVVGGPTHAMAMSRPTTREDAIRQGAGQGLVRQGLREWLSGLPEDLHELPFATFDTRVSKVRRLPGSAARGAARVLRRRKGRLVTPPESFYVEDVDGPLGEDQVELARTWGRGLVAARLRGRGATAR